MIITDPKVIIDVVCDAYEFMTGNIVMQSIPDEDIIKLFEDDTSAYGK